MTQLVIDLELCLDAVVMGPIQKPPVAHPYPIPG